MLETKNKVNLKINFMLKKDQLVLLPIHEEIGKVEHVTAEKAVIRVHSKRTQEIYDVIVTPEGLLPHTDVSIVQQIPFRIGENVMVKIGGKQTGITLIGEITEFNVVKVPETTFVSVTIMENGEDEYKVPIDNCYKLWELKKFVDKLCRKNDKFAQQE